MSHNNIKIFSCVLIAFVFSFFLLFIFLDSYGNKYDIDSLTEENFYRNHLDSQDKNILILGSSHVGRLNATYMNEFLSKNGYENYVIFNMGKSNDLPKDRLKVMDSIISKHPEMVLYGVGYTDLGYVMQPKNIVGGTITSQLNCREQEFFSRSNTLVPGMLSLIDFGFSKLENPKKTTVNILFNENKLNNLEVSFKDIHDPFYPANSIDAKIITDEKLKELSQQYCYYKDPLDEKEEISSLRQIIDKLQNHNIRVVLFLVPNDKYSLYSTSESEKKSFNSTLSTISSQYNVPVYSLLEKYENLNVWNHLNHVAMNPNAVIYSNDISGIIVKEITK